jgi:hypothetical protein
MPGVLKLGFQLRQTSKPLMSGRFDVEHGQVGPLRPRGGKRFATRRASVTT